MHLNRSVLSLLATFTLAAPAAIALAPAAQADTAAQAARLGSRTLGEGATGTDVRSLQRLLHRTGFGVAVDGQFGSDTTKAVRSFQSVTGLRITGLVDRITVRGLVAATKGAGAAAAADNGGFSQSAAKVKRSSLGDRLPVRRGMSGRDVKMLQTFLRRAGVGRVSVDGQFGTGTYRAVRSWEAQASRRVDGQMDGGDVATLRDQVGAVRGAASDPGTTAPAGPPALAPGDKAKVGPGGLAIAPADAPDAVKQIIAAGNQIATKPYIYGGGHRADWKLDRGYDCSGSVSWALHGAGLVESPMPSGGYYTWGEAGPGQWVTIYTKDSHMYMIVAGLRFDTSGRSNAGTRWQADIRSPSGFTARHPTGL